MRRPSLFFALAVLALSACGEVAVRTNDDAGPSTTRDAGSLDAYASDDDASASSDDAWVAPMDPDAYVEPAACPRIRVNTPGEVLNIRPTPSTSMPVIGTLPHNALVEVAAMVRGEAIGGVDLWYEIRSSAGNGFVFSSFAICTTDEPPADTGYYVPFVCGAAIRVTQSPGGGLSHTGRAMYAFDFGVPLETEIRAMRPGMVTYVFTETGPGDPCYGGGGTDCGPLANLVIIAHADGTTAAYKHINSASVTVGQRVAQGDVIARSGSTGYSTGPHLHAEVRSGCPTTVYCDTIPFSFTDVGSPAAPVTVTSGNCP